MAKNVKNVIETITANCQDCYRCVRACPVKAIRISNAQARIVDDLCIHCGTCVRECPKQAKVSISQLAGVKELLASGCVVAASVAPSFAGRFYGWKQTRLPAALRMLGFAHVAETAEGAAQVSRHSIDEARGKSAAICGACPVVVNYIEKYRPEYLDILVPVTSPMIMHGRMLKKRYGEQCKVVFIGPCAAKKQEALRPENEGVIDHVLTFDELEEWLEEEGIDLATCPESGFESFGDIDMARLYPIQGGMLKSCNMECDNTSTDVLHLSGAQEFFDLLDIPAADWEYDVVEPLFCSEGCINGPCFCREKKQSIFARKNRVIKYAASATSLPDPYDYENVDYSSYFDREAAVEEEEIDEAAINKVFEQTGKSNPDLRLNCGACGYNSCRDNAIAVVRGMAEPEMCMPYMRRMAQHRTDKIIETSPNGVVVLDSELNMVHVNPAFQKMFMCTNEILGRRISYLIDAEGFEKLATGAVTTYEAIKSKYGKKYHEVLYALPDEDQYVGIYNDISQIKFDSSQLDLIKRQTVQQAKELLDNQIRFSQEMAHFLGRSTAQNEEMVKQLIDLYDFETGGKK